MIYFYEDHNSGDLYVAPIKIPSEQLYCPHCNKSDAYLGCAKDKFEASAILDHYNHTFIDESGNEDYIESKTKHPNQYIENLIESIYPYGAGFSKYDLYS